MERRIAAIEDMDNCPQIMCSHARCDYGHFMKHKDDVFATFFNYTPFKKNVPL